MIRLATVGTSLITERFIAAVKLCDNIRISAVYSRRAETGNAFAKRVGCDRVFCNLEEMASSNDIDAVYIASPNSFHYSQSKLFLQNGKNVICEKPITVTVEEYIELKALADSKNLVYMEAIMSRHTLYRNKVKEAVAEIGRISMARIDYCQLSSRYAAYLKGERHNIFDMSLCAGTLMDLGVYTVWAAVDLLGAPKSVTAKASFDKNGTDLSGSALLEYDGFTAVLSYSKIGNSAIGCEIIGDKGTLKIGTVSQYGNVTLIADGKQNVICDLPEIDYVMSGEVNRFTEFILNKQEHINEYNIISQQTLQVRKVMDEIVKTANIKYFMGGKNYETGHSNSDL